MDQIWTPFRLDRTQWVIILGVGGLGLIMHLLTAGNYGIFRDELYYLDCANHLAWGYVDHPPLSILLLKLSTTVFGDSVWAIRLLPATAGVMLIVLTGLLTSRMGGGRFAVLLASLATLTVPVYLINTGFFSMNAFDLVLWGALFLVVAEIAATGNTQLWLWFGLLFGLAMLNKIGVVALGLGMLPALLLTGRWRHLKCRHLWGGVIIAGALFAPHVIWQIANDWPTSEFIRNATADKIVSMSLLEFFQSQILTMNPGLFLFWMVGLGVLLFWPRLRPYRIFGLLWIFCFLFYGLQRSKPYYLSPAYPPLIAAAAVAIGHWLAIRLRWLRPVLITLTLAGGVFVAPLCFPLLPPGDLIAYMKRIGIHPQAEETSGQAELPQYLADRFGWENMTRTVAEAYHQLPDSLRTGCTIVARNYGEAGAINYFGAEFGLPRAVSQHNTYYLWGVNSSTGDPILAINYSDSDLRQVYDSVSAVALIESPWAMPYEAHCWVHLCSGLKVPFDEVWRDGKLYH